MDRSSSGHRRLDTKPRPRTGSQPPSPRQGRRDHGRASKFTVVKRNDLHRHQHSTTTVTRTTATTDKRLHTKRDTTKTANALPFPITHKVVTSVTKHTTNTKTSRVHTSVTTDTSTASEGHDTGAQSTSSTRKRDTTSKQPRHTNKARYPAARATNSKGKTPSDKKRGQSPPSSSKPPQRTGSPDIAQPHKYTRQRDSKRGGRNSAPAVQRRPRPTTQAPPLQQARKPHQPQKADPNRRVGEKRTAWRTPTTSPTHTIRVLQPENTPANTATPLPATLDTRRSGVQLTVGTQRDDRWHALPQCIVPGQFVEYLRLHALHNNMEGNRTHREAVAVIKRTAKEYLHMQLRDLICDRIGCIEMPAHLRTAPTQFIIPFPPQAQWTRKSTHFSDIIFRRTEYLRTIFSTYALQRPKADVTSEFHLFAKDFFKNMGYSDSAHIHPAHHLCSRTQVSQFLAPSVILTFPVYKK